MTLREFDIPFGPDKTGGLGFAALGIPASEEELEEITEEASDEDILGESRGSWKPFSWEPEPEVPSAPAPSASKSPERDPHAPFSELVTLAEEPSESREGTVRTTPSLEGLREALPTVDSAAQTAPQKAVVIPETSLAHPKAARTSRGSNDRDLGGDANDVSTSFSALRDSIGQGRELKAREKELEEFKDQLAYEREELEDREDILAHFDAIVAEQDSIMERATQRRERDKAELASIVERADALSQELTEVHEYHMTGLQPLEADLGRAQATADQAKNDERSRKSELAAADNELRKTNGGNDSTMALAKRDRIQEAYDHACDVSGRAQAALAEVQRVYDDAVTAMRQAEGPLHRSLKDLEHREAELKDFITELGEEISAARKRRTYCETVHQYPEETAKLRATVQHDEETLAEMQADFEELEDLHDQTRIRARKAKIAIGLVAIIIVIFIVALIVILTRG